MHTCAVQQTNLNLFLRLPVLGQVSQRIMSETGEVEPAPVVPVPIRVIVCFDDRVFPVRLIIGIYCKILDIFQEKKKEKKRPHLTLPTTHFSPLYTHFTLSLTLLAAFNVVLENN